MMTIHDLLRGAADYVIKGQQQVIAGVASCPDSAHQESLVRVSGWFNDLTSKIYQELGRLERPDDDDEEQ